MKISVLISIYCKEKPEYLKQALESIVNQTYMPSQIVIIKDGKLTPELEAVLEEYKAKYEKLIDIYGFERKQGLGKALKYGVEKCKFEYIARQDTDDISPLYRFEKQIEVLKNNRNIDILGGYIEEYDENMEALISVRKVPLETEKIKKYIKIQSPFNHGTVIMKKQSILHAGNYDETKLEDYDLWARMLISGCNMANIPIILGKNRTGNSMYKRRSGIQQVKKVLEIEKKLLNYKIISIPTYIKNIVIRTGVALLPLKTKKFIYTKLIRGISV